MDRDIHACMYTSLSTYVYMYVCVYIGMYMCMYTYRYMYMYMYMYLPEDSKNEAQMDELMCIYRGSKTNRWVAGRQTENILA